jgi:RNA polymerase sigma-70 factor (ECF subfamily)
VTRTAGCATRVSTPSARRLELELILARLARPTLDALSILRLPAGAGLKVVRPVTAPSKHDDLALIQRLIGGNADAWSEFVARFSSAIFGAVINTLRKAGFNTDDGVDIAQDVYVRLCKDNCHLLRQFDPQRASLRTWLGVVSSSTAIDYLRRNKRQGLPLESVPEELYQVEPKTPEQVKIPPGLLSERQALVLRLLYDRDLDAAEVAAMLGIDSQTVRSTHHKALVKLRKYFAEGKD